MTPTQALDAAIVGVNGPFTRNAAQVADGIRKADLIREQLRWHGFDVVPLPKGGTLPEALVEAASIPVGAA